MSNIIRDGAGRVLRPYPAPSGNMEVQRHDKGNILLCVFQKQ